MSYLTHRARALRKNSTNAERLLWSRLRRNAVEGFHFRRQVPLCGFIADFVCFEARLVVEVDGATHSLESELAANQRRDARLIADGFRLQRVLNDDVYRNVDGVVETIRMRLWEAPPGGVSDNPPAP